MQKGLDVRRNQFNRTRVQTRFHRHRKTRRSMSSRPSQLRIKYNLGNENEKEKNGKMSTSKYQVERGKVMPLLFVQQSMRRDGYIFDPFQNGSGNTMFVIYVWFWRSFYKLRKSQFVTKTVKYHTVNYIVWQHQRSRLLEAEKVLKNAKITTILVLFTTIKLWHFHRYMKGELISFVSYGS